MEQYSLNLTLEEVNQVLSALSQVPYFQVFETIEKIKSQTQAQIQAQEIRQQELVHENA
jgi:hypothetical protein